MCFVSLGVWRAHAYSAAAAGPLCWQGHVAHDTLEALGDLGAISFHDLNPDLTPFQRRFTKHIRRCDELERIIRYFEDEMTKYEVKPQVCPDAHAVVDMVLKCVALAAVQRDTFRVRHTPANSGVCARIWGLAGEARIWSVATPLRLLTRWVAVVAAVPAAGVLH